jgi:phosphomannomutase
MRAYIFDVDGTLTPSRSKMNEEFAEWFLGFCYRNEVYLVTGSDYPKTMEQVGENIVNAVKRCYNCSGSSVWENGVEIWHNEFKITDQQEKWLRAHLNLSTFPLRTGNHFEYRTGMLNFSIVGRNANKEERRQYVKYDHKTRERHRLAEQFNDNWQDVKATVGGETGLDIAQLGMDKSQILRDFDNVPITFFGDRMEEDGNDYTLAEKLWRRQMPDPFNRDYVYHIEDWEHTWSTLQNLDKTRYWRGVG